MTHSFIDLHCHTIASKENNGESKKRNVPNKEFFLNKLKESNVSVVAITNHNYFNCEQYEDFKNNKDIIVFPGIEIDIELLKGTIGHLLFVSNSEDEKYSLFLKFVSKIKANVISEACNIKIKLTEFPELISNLDGLIIVHYGGKASSFSNEDIEYLKQNCSQNLFVEPSSLISAFIYLNKGMQSIIGSDVKDWNNYPGKELPELKVPIESFSKLKLLLKKDEKIINQKTKSKLFDDKFQIINEKYDIDEKIQLYRDCNVIMGTKSSGKSIFLKAIKSELISRGLQGKIKYYSAEDAPELYKKIKSYLPSDEELNEFANTSNLFKNEIEEVKKFTFPKIEKTFKQIDEFFKFSICTKLAKQLGFVSCFTNFPDNSYVYNQKKDKLKNDYHDIAIFRKSEKYKEYLNSDKTNNINNFLDEAKENIISELKESFILNKSLIIATKCISDFKSIFTQLKSTAAMPNTTGLKELYEKENEYLAKVTRLRDIIQSEKKQTQTTIGFLDGKGKVSFIKEVSSIIFYSKSKNPITLFKSGFSTNAKKIFDSLNLLCENKYGPEFTNNILNISKLLVNYDITSIKDFLGFQSYFVRENGDKFDPSKGEQAILVLSNCINDNNPSTEFYLLDEPEMSVGHHYVNSTIVPRIKELCSLDKCVVVCTHDANIGVGTLPFQVIYREEDITGCYHTYLGNPFSGILIDQFSNKINWKDTAINVLEGGREALELREVTYGDRD